MVLEAWRPKIKVPAGSGSGEIPFPGCRQLSSLCPHAKGRGAELCDASSSENTNPIMRVCPHSLIYASFCLTLTYMIINLNCFLLLIFYKISFPEPLKGLVLNSFSNHIPLRLPVRHSCQASVQRCGGFYSELDSLSSLLSEPFSFLLYL